MTNKPTLKERVETVLEVRSWMEGVSDSSKDALVAAILELIEGERKQWALETVDKYFGVHIPCDVTKERQRIREAVKGMKKEELPDSGHTRVEAAMYAWDRAWNAVLDSVLKSIDA